MKKILLIGAVVMFSSSVFAIPVCGDGQGGIGPQGPDCAYASGLGCNLGGTHNGTGSTGMELGDVSLCPELNPDSTPSHMQLESSHFRLSGGTKVRYDADGRTIKSSITEKSKKE